jgi:hypothetical protein
MRALILSVAATVWAGATFASPYAFEGRWDCQVAEFTFTATIYNNGTEDMPITDIAAEDNGFVLSFEDDYQLSVAVNDDGTLHWFSPASGDSFTCARLN